MDDSLRGRLMNLKAADVSYLEMVFRMAEEPKIGESLDRIGKSRSWWDNIDDFTKDEIKDCASNLRAENVERALFRLEEAAERAANALIDLLEARDPKVRIQAANDVLAYVGLRNDEVEQHPNKLTIEGLESTINAIYKSNNGNNKEEKERTRTTD